MRTETRPLKIEDRPSIVAGSVAYLLMLAACIALIRPFVNAGISDDFSYIMSAKVFAETGRMIYNGGATAILGWLIPFGALFIKLFGFSFTTARIATFVIAALNGLLLQWILLRVGCTRVLALFGATAVMLSRASLPEAMLFFTDGPGLFAMLVTFALCIRILGAKTSRATQFWIAAAFSASFLLGTVRQLLWLGTLLMVPCAVWLVRKRRGVLLWTSACFVLAVLAIAEVLHWWNHQPYFLNEPLILHYPLASWARYVILPPIELLVLMAPVLSIFLAHRASRRIYVISAVLALVSLLGIMANPYDLLRTASHDIFGEAPQWVFLLALTYASALLPITLQAAREGLAVGSHTARNGPITLRGLLLILAPFSLVVFALVISRASFYPRYLLESVAALTIWLIKLWSDSMEQKVGCGIVAPLLVAVYCAFSVIQTHDLFRSAAATLSSIQWYTSQGMPRNELEAGFDFDGWYQIERTGFVNDQRIRVPAGAYVNQHLPDNILSCHNFFLPDTPSIHPVYGVGESLAPCFEAPVLHSVDYTAWMAPHHRTIFIAKYMPSYALPPG